MAQVRKTAHVRTIVARASLAGIPPASLGMRPMSGRAEAGRMTSGQAVTGVPVSVGSPAATQPSMPSVE
jgi:hypothetical protein